MPTTTPLEILQYEGREKFMETFRGHNFNAPTRLNLMQFGDELIAHAYHAGIKAAMDLVEEEDPSTNRTTSSAYWGNKLRARMNQLLSNQGIV